MINKQKGGSEKKEIQKKNPGNITSLSFCSNIFSFFLPSRCYTTPPPAMDLTSLQTQNTQLGQRLASISMRAQDLEQENILLKKRLASIHLSRTLAPTSSSSSSLSSSPLQNNTAGSSTNTNHTNQQVRKIISQSWTRFAI